ncbi:bifunctional adenosylcobinamide kinase/adenosylcobinamide-phosphate guanylyltransferase [Rhizobiaceae bacterium BDR2-2]|uniref:Bifunctional adenosylcobalamin biosynthesis protein n=1 Tax=Ectorhizobium quercum TaxID=2965071 RepID=A0AAE3N4E0_9HYPH|nr:bifunctional adenosylcobinamide kinase/adenosylcobinamide-phosphate guanylyltransferase [Ectorhizobium quercum]MCX8999777.1 bifunctional adenosylcobinamide kinase/adenosylcobinamide-phosphate guanylyltransferase [Ectorhizobium quercum]
MPDNRKTGLVLVLGGARSGKSRFSETMLAQSGLDVHYVATAEALDGEMNERIAHHRASRPAQWATHEIPLDLPQALLAIDAPGRGILVDCLTLWITNLMMAGRDIGAAFDALAEACPKLRGRVVFVSNEVGLGIVPEHRMARDFRDHAGRLHQRIAALADEVYFVAAGLPLRMKG